MSRIGIGIIGLDHWYWALGCAYNIAINPNAELMAISDPDEEKAKKIARVYGAKTYYADYHDLLENPGVEAVIITTTTVMHPDVAIAAAEAKKDILVGKPIARTLKEADKIIDASRKANVKLMAMAAGPLPEDPVKKLIEEGAIGVPFAAHFSLLAIPPLREPGIDEPGWFVDPRKAAGGGFIDHAVYDIALLRSYFGSEVERIYAEMGKFIHKDYEVEDHGMALLKFRNGSVATVESSFTATTESHSRKVIMGTEGEIEIGSDFISIWGKKEPYRQKVIIKTTSPPPVFSRTYAEIPVPTPPFALVYKPMVDEFIACIKENRKPILTGEDARAVLEICLAAYESVRKGKSVNLPLEAEVDVPAILKNL